MKGQDLRAGFNDFKISSGIAYQRAWLQTTHKNRADIQVLGMAFTPR
jgi:hypothetical protein